MVFCLGQGADLRMVQLMPLSFTLIISCSSKSRLVLSSWFYLSGARLPGWSRTKSKRPIKWLCVCVCVCACMCVCMQQIYINCREVWFCVKW